MKLSGSPFENSPVCKGVGYVADAASMDMAKIELMGRYPERGWVMNENVHEMAYVLSGSGEFLAKGEEPAQVNEGDILSVNPGKKYAWSGTMTLLVACNPPFDPSQHKEVEEN